MKLWWRIVLPVILVAGVVFVIVVFSSATDKDPEEVVVVKHTEYRSPFIPDSVAFAGEWLPLNRFDVKEALDRELLSNAYFHSQTMRYIKLAPRYFSIIEPILKEKGVPEDFKYLAVAESGLNPRAVSPAGAVGFWQFLRGTAQEYGLVINSEVDERYHVEKATYAACDYLLKAYRKYQSWTMVAAAYNAGPTGMARQILRQKSESYFDLLLVEETGRYVFRIAALKLIMENPELYNFYISEDEKYPVITTRIVEVDGAVEDFADFAKEQGINYKLLKDFNPWLRQTYLKNPGAKKYVIEIPVLEKVES
ncbi:transglycosylase SLT domain-containing protein [Maribellus comscasis]|uniref:Transglycosylase SLT domain-containing protein n=1 Tax=Maribellus comscasis TaxID=2681766 RepID=A0A6I6JVN3_9BACT|nr:lytic transglycosylase domain-containing protein [Maribellus comscasis]QGY43333.1 transglycosylase SLT domain-containing protein [Maribellus comscasis]